MKSSKKVVIISVVFIIMVICSFCIFSFKSNNTKIDKILRSSSYSYLPKEAKNYVRDVYENTGKVILTEKNKKENKLYLNPHYVDYLTYSDKEKDELGEIPMPMTIDYVSSDEVQGDLSIPKSYNLRNVNGKNYVTPVRNQGDLGICWAFATAGVAESHLLKSTDTSYTSSSRLISERQIDYLTATNGLKDYKSEYGSFVDRTLGDGGNFYISTIALANGVSLFDYNSFKSYNDKDLSKMELSDVISYNKSLYELNSTTNFPDLDLRESTSQLTDNQVNKRTSYLNKVKEKIMNQGAAYVSTYMDSSCQYVDSNLNNTVIDVYRCNDTGGHAMQIIGWNDDLEYSYCADTTQHKKVTSTCNKVVSGKGVWILKNSWGSSIQYPYLTYDSLDTGINFIDEIESSENKDWDNNYIIGDGEYYSDSDVYTLANTKIKDSEKIRRVKFIAANQNGTYHVKIKKKDGTYATFTKENELPGLISIDITGDVVVDKDTEITVYGDDVSYIDRVSIFTSNINTEPFIDLSQYKNKSISDDKMRLYSETKNIPSNTTLIYKVYDSFNNDVSNSVTITNNVVAENNINTLASFSDDLSNGTYRIDVIYNSNVINSINVDIAKMDGNGTSSNPYIIINSAQLYQIRNNLDAHYELGSDIDLTEDTKPGGKYSLESDYCSGGFGWEAINGFSGSLDGKGHTIKGLSQRNYITCDGYTVSNDKGNGLFGKVKKNATIKNLVLDDFNIICQKGDCGLLVSKYLANMNESGNPDYSDDTLYSATFKNIAVKNSKISGGKDSNTNYGGGLFGYIESAYGNVEISNIYLDINVNTKELKRNAYLASVVQGSNLNIENIRVLGDLKGKYSDGSGDEILINNVYEGENAPTIKNILSTVTATNVGGSLIGTSGADNIVISNVNMLDIDNKPVCKNNCSNISNVNVYNKDNQLVELTRSVNYNHWQNFSDNWVMETVDGIPRIPVLKFMDFEYTKIPNISYNYELNKKVSIFDYITPKIDAAKIISYRSNNDSIVKVSDDGTLIPLKSGNTTIHVESLYDGYIKDVPITVTYIPHYNVKFDANGGTGEMESIEVRTGNNFTLPANKFEKKNYVFNGWNTKADGSGTSYADLGTVKALSDKQTITLYAQWIGEERVVTFDANGGVVNPSSKVVRYGGTYGELPIPVRDGYAFDFWMSGNFMVEANTNIIGYNLKASWKNNAYTIIYDANNGKLKSNYHSDSGQAVMSDTKVTSTGNNNQDTQIMDCMYEKDGYIFKEWNTKADGTGISYSVTQTINRSSNITLYAIWKKDSGTITYNSNYGTIQTKKQSFTFDVNTKLDKNTFTRTGYVFVGWNTNSDGTGTSYSDEQIINKSENLTLYAQWKKIPRVYYQTHVQSYGWQGYVRDGQMSGTSGEAKRLEGIRIKLDNTPYSGGVQYRTHVQSYGWQNFVSNNQMSGTSGEAKRLEAIEIRLTGEMAEHYDIYYRVHAQSYGWLDWAKNGESAGTASLAKRLEGIEIVLVEKGKSAPGSTKRPFVQPLIAYQTHVQSYGWQSYVMDGAMSGTSGQAKRLEGIRIKLLNPKYSGGVQYRTHVQSYGWQNFVSDNQMSGTSGEAKRLEAIEIRLTGEMANHYDIYYRVHAQSYGWLDWAKNGESAGTAALAKRLEGIEIVLVEKGEPAPGSTQRPFVQG